MPQIRVGNFGNVTPGRAPQVNAGQEAAAIARVGATLVDVGTDMRRQETELALRERREQEQIAAAAQRAREGAALHATEDRLRDLHDEVSEAVLSGQIDTNASEAEFGTRAKKLVDEAMPGFSEQNREAAGLNLQRVTGTLGNAIRRTNSKRDRQNVTSSIAQSLEHFERMYRTDPVNAEKGVAGTLAAMGPFSTLTPEQIAKAGQDWKERTQFTVGFEAVTGARDNRKGLADAEKLINSLPDLDPQKRASLIDRANSYRMALDAKEEAAARRRDAERDRYLNRAQHEFNAFQALADKGTALDPAYLDRALTTTAGTPYHAAIKGLAEQAKATGGLAAQPLAVQQAELDRITAQIAQSGRTPELDKRQAQVEKVLRGSREDLAKDGLRAAFERGVIADLKPLNMAGGLMGIGDQLAERVTAAQRASQWAGAPVSPLTDDEAANVKRQLDALPAKERSTVVAALAQGIGPQQAQGLAAQMDKKDRALSLAFASAGDRTTAGRLTSELILRGQAAKADGTSTKGEKQPDVKANAWRAHASTQLDGVFGNAAFTTQVRDAAELIMHGIAAEQGGRLTTDDMDRAVRLAVGGSIIEHNGRRIPLPAEVSEDVLEKRLRSVDAAEMEKQAPGGTVRAGGVPMPVADFVKTLPGQQLMPVRPGQYAVLVGGRPVTNAQGTPIVIGVK